MPLDRNYVIILVVGVVITILLFIVDIWFGLMAVIGMIALIMSVYIMQDTLGNPDIVAVLRDESKSLELRNRGNAVAVAIHVAVVPHNVEFDIPALQVEERYTYHFDRMIDEAKVVAAYQNEKGVRYSKTYMLNAFEKGDDDLLKPSFPLFKWKDGD